MVGADARVLGEHPGGVWHHQAEEDHRADHGDRRAGQQHHRDDPPQAYEAEPAAEGGGHVVAEGEAVECGRGGQRQYRADRQERQQAADDGAVLVREGARGPEAVAVQGVGIGEDDRVGEREQQEGDGDSGQREFDRRRARAARPAEQEDQHAGAERTGEGEPDRAVQRTDPEQGDGHHDSEGRARADAEDAGVGERVSGEGLHERAGEPQGRARGGGEDGARYPDGPDDVVHQTVRGVAQQRPDDLVRGDVDGPQPQRQHAQRHEGGGERYDEQERARVCAGGHRPGSTATILRLGIP